MPCPKSGEGFTQARKERMKMTGTTNTGIATVGPEKGVPEVATLLPQDGPGERGERRPRRNLGCYQRFFLVPLIALAFFGVVSAAAPREAEAHDYYEWQNWGGVWYECWVAHYTDGNHYTEGCIWYVGNSYPAYYTDVSGNTYVWWNQRWNYVSNYWRSLSNTSGYAPYVLSFNTNPNGFSLLMGTASAYSRTAAWVNDSTSAFVTARNSESILTNPTPIASSEVPPPPSEASQNADATADSEVHRTSEVSSAEVSSAAFPWKVCQDNNANCMKYGTDAWTQVFTSKAQGGSYRVSSSKTRGAFFAAAGATDAGGSTMDLTTKTGPNMGKAKVIVVNLADARVVKQVTFNLQTPETLYNVAKNITGLTPHMAYGLMIVSAEGRPVAVDAVGYEAHGSMCHEVL
jgi:hypothetical protein